MLYVRSTVLLALCLYVFLLPMGSSGDARSQAEADRGETSKAAAIRANALRDHIFFLASEALGGRHVGSEGLEKGSKYIESQFKAAALKPVIADDNGSTYRMGVPMLRRTSTADPTALVETPAGRKVFAHGDDFKWFMGNMIASEGRRLEVVYAGYGISEPDYGWDDLKGVDLEGKAVLFMAGAPTRGGKPVLPQAVHERYAQLRSLMKKLYPMMAKKAAAMLLIADQEIVDMWEAIPSMIDGPHLAYANRSPGAQHVGCLYVLTPDMVRSIFAGQRQAPPGTGLGITETTDGFALNGAFLTLNAAFADEVVPAWNLVGVVEGRDPKLKDEYIAVTAHLDTNAPKDGEVMNGADDDASGCAGLVEIAKAVAADPPRRSVVFVLFTGEEGGVAGSCHFVSACPVPLNKIRTDVNLDGIGRSDPAETERTHFALDSDKITPELTQLIKDVNFRTVNWPLKYQYRMGDSDHMVFHAVGIPAVNFYSGHHDDVNTPTDDPEKVDFEKTQQISRLVYEVTMELANRDVLWR